MEPFSFTTRDGLEVHGYLTFPLDGREALATVLNVHGGPWARDSWGYDPTAQWLANRGYLCVQVNFRGSTGYGKEFLNAGDKQWGARMHDDLRIQHGERVLLLGPSGAGKSTLLAALAGLLADDSGERRRGEVDGRPPAPERVGIVFQDPQTQLVMARSGDDVAFGLENLGVPAAGDLAAGRRGARRGRLPVPADRPTHALSGGEQQRLALAGVLALRPGLLLLDEPTANLDPAGAALVRAAVAASPAATPR